MSEKTEKMVEDIFIRMQYPTASSPEAKELLEIMCLMMQYITIVEKNSKKKTRSWGDGEY